MLLLPLQIVLREMISFIAVKGSGQECYRYFILFYWEIVVG